MPPTKPAEPLPSALPKAPRGLSFDSADRSSIRALSQASPMPQEAFDDEPDPEEEIDTLFFERGKPPPGFEELEALTRITGANDPAGEAPTVPDPPPTPRFAPPLPIPPREAIEHPTGTRRGVAPIAPPPDDLTRPRTLRRPVVLERRRFPWGGIAILTVAAAVGALIGWLATPYVHEAPAAEAARVTPPPPSADQ